MVVAKVNPAGTSLKDFYTDVKALCFIALRCCPPPGTNGEPSPGNSLHPHAPGRPCLPQAHAQGTPGVKRWGTGVEMGHEGQRPADAGPRAREAHSRISILEPRMGGAHSQHGYIVAICVV